MPYTKLFASILIGIICLSHATTVRASFEEEYSNEDLGFATSDISMEDILAGDDVDYENSDNYKRVTEEDMKNYDTYSSPDAVRDSLSKQFLHHDSDEDGTITADEFHELLLSIGGGANKEGTRQILEMADSNSDGLLSLEEWTALVLSTGNT